MPKLVLIAENDLEARQAMHLLVNIWGHAVIVARNGLEAVELVMRLRPDVVVMNLQLPILNGMEATEFIHLAKPCSSPAIIALAPEGAPSRRATADAGFIAHLIQPVPPAELRAVLEYA